ncbi:fumarylacetoacetate hydrolase family protein [Herbiconiux sp. 11R-BC]|uniref:fumarylacetoacetate hydrolase family protein n=1 Tax=Herbiconiux sp. 11R-BC TaxID=3111637 RepID=UPI003C0CAD3A
MIIARFNGGRIGIVKGDRIHDISASFGSAEVPRGSIVDLFSAGSRFCADDVGEERGELVSGVVLEAPIERPGKIIGAPANYYEHIDEMPDSATIRDWGTFLKAPTSITGPEGRVRLPYNDVRTDYEGELAVVIGTGGRDITADRALEHVFGYTCVLDITIRSSEDRSTRKSFDTFTPLGPWIVTADEIPDPGDLILKLDVNGDVRQHSSTSKMIFGVPELIAYASSVMTLEPGDIIATGTPAGVGPIVDGDVVTMEIEKIGQLRVYVDGRESLGYAERPGPRPGLYA